VANDAKLQNTYVLLGIEDVESLIFCFLFCIWLCFVVLQVTMFDIVLQSNNLSELVLEMERNPCCSVDSLYGECESRFLEMSNTIVSREWEDEIKDGLYEAR